MARSILSDGIFAERHLTSTMRSRGFIPGSPPPTFAVMAISRASFEKIFPRLASTAPLKCLTFAHLLCPAIPQFPVRNLFHLFHEYRCAVAQYFRDTGGDLGGIVAHANHGVGAELAGVRQH